MCHLYRRTGLDVPLLLGFQSFKCCTRYLVLEHNARFVCSTYNGGTARIEEGQTCLVLSIGCTYIYRRSVVSVSC